MTNRAQFEETISKRVLILRADHSVAQQNQNRIDFVFEFAFVSPTSETAQSVCGRAPKSVRKFRRILIKKSGNYENEIKQIKVALR